MHRKLLGVTTTVAVVAADVARHMAWYLSYRVDGSTRPGEFVPGPEPS